MHALRTHRDAPYLIIKDGKSKGEEFLDLGGYLV
jgi:hypothetical protein